MEEIMYEQRKKNAKNERRNQRLINDYKNNNDDEKENINNYDNLMDDLNNEISKIETIDILAQNVAINETNGDINENLLATKLNKIRYGEYDNTTNIKNRIKKCIKEAEKGRDKKADMALNDGIIANLYLNNNWSKTISKFPKGKEIKLRINEPKPTFNLTEQDIKKVLQGLNPKSKGGRIGINNDLFYGCNNDAT